MGKWILGFGVAIVLAWLLINVRTSPVREARAAADDRVAPAEKMDGVARATAARPAAKLAPPPAVKVLSLTSEQFYERVDEVAPRRLYSAAVTKCYEGGMHRDFKMRLAYKLHVKSGQVTFSDVKILLSTFQDPKLETCMRDAVAASTWQDPELPDYDTEDELLLRVRGMKKYLELDDAGEDAKAEAEGE